MVLSIYISLLMFWGVVCHLGAKHPAGVTRARSAMAREREKQCLERRESNNYAVIKCRAEKAWITSPSTNAK